MANDTRIDEISLLLVGLSQFLRVSMPDELIETYARELVDMPIASVARGVAAMKKIVPPHTSWYPMPAQIREAAAGSTRDNAVTAANLILAELEAGRSGAYLDDEAYAELMARIRDRVGELGWQVIKSMGGWARLYREYCDSKPGIMRSQLATTAETVQRRAIAGLLDEPPALPAPAAPRAALQGTSSIAKLLSGKIVEPKNGA